MRKRELVSFEFDPAAPKPLTKKQMAELATLAALPEDHIDTSDIPPTSENFWRDAVRNPFYRPVKQQLTVRLDADVLAWLRSEGRGYQTKLNGILREAMLRELVRR